MNFRTPKGLEFSALNPQTGLPYLEVAGRALEEVFLPGQEVDCNFRDADGFCTKTQTITIREDIVDLDDLNILEEIEGSVEEYSNSAGQEDRKPDISVQVGSDSVF